MSVDRATKRLIAERYELQERLGQGGMGVVWRARDTLLQRPVAVKTLRIPMVPDDDDRARLRERVLREARAAARLNHPGVVTVFDVIDDEEPAIIMELVDSPNLADLVRRDGPLSPARAATIGLEVLDALAAAHAEGIVHRDVKPANVMVPEGGQVRLSDFGVAALVDDPSVTASMTIAGSPSYMAPEQATTHARGPAADMWSLGATLYFAVEGKPPYDKGSPLPTLASIVNDPAPTAPRAGALQPAIEALLVKDPGARPTVADLRPLLEAAADGSSTAAEEMPATEPAVVTEAFEPAPVEVPAPPEERVAPVSPPAEPERPVTTTTGGGDRARRFAVAATVAVVLALIVVLLVSVGRSSDDGSTPDTTTAPDPQTTQTDENSGVAVPADWQRYTDPDTGFAISHPPAWTVRRNGTLTDFVDPESGAYLRVDHVQPPGPSPEGAWYEFEPRFAAENPGYRRIQITPTTYAGFDAAIWEFTYGSGAGERRAVDLGFVTDRYGFALNFQTPSSEWERLQPVFEAFKASFQAPAG